MGRFIALIRVCCVWKELKQGKDCGRVLFLGSALTCPSA